MSISIEDLTKNAADDLLDEHGIERTSTDPLADFIDQIGDQPREWSHRSGPETLVRYTVELDRRQRDLVEVISEALDDRGAQQAARLVRDTDPQDDLWNNYLGPILDSLEDDYTAMAQELLG